MTVIDQTYRSGEAAGYNYAAGQGGCAKPTRGKTKASQAFADGWQKGFEAARRLIDSEERAFRVTQNSWS